jgi:hypothetical protein
MTIANELYTAGGPDDAARPDLPARLRLVQVGDEDWLIHDLLFPANDARRLVACVRERGDDHVEVIWLQGAGAPTQFPRVEDALVEAERILPGKLPAAAERDPWE